MSPIHEIDQKHYKNLRDYENNKRDEFYKKYSEKAIAGKRAKTINCFRGKVWLYI